MIRKIFSMCFFAVFLIITAGATSVLSEEMDDSKEETEQSEKTEVLRPSSGEVFMNIGEIVVKGRDESLENIDLPGSVDVLGSDEIKYENVNDALELLRKVPGIGISDYGGAGVPKGITIRGFESTHSRYTTVTVDGIPINTHLQLADGAPDLNALPAEEIDQIEVVKGSLDARYGNWSRAGLLHFKTRTRGDFHKAKVSYGSWDSKKIYASIGAENFDGKFNQIYSVDYFDSDGWRDDTPRDRENGFARWYFRPSDNLQIGLHTHIYKADWTSGGYIPESAWLEDPRQNTASSATDGGSKDLTEGSLHIDWDIAPNLVLETKAWLTDATRSGFNDWGSGQTECYWESQSYGFLTNLGWDTSVFAGKPFKLDVGFDYRFFDDHGEEWNTISRTRTSLVSGSEENGDYNFTNYGIYLKANFDPTSYLRLFAGLRHDWFTGDMTEWETGVYKEMRDYNITTYKGGVIVTPIEKYSIYANAATTFALPNGADKYDANAPDEKNFFFWEIGFKGEPWSWLLFRYAYFDQEESGLELEAGKWVDYGDARRKGHEIEINVVPYESLQFFTSYTYYDAKYETGDNSGKDLKRVPDYLFKLGVQYTFPWKTTEIRGWYNKVGGWYTSADNEHSYEGYNTVDLKLVQKIGKRLSLTLDVKNLTDEVYSEWVSYWSGENQYATADARSFYLSLNYDFK